MQFICPIPIATSIKRNLNRNLNANIRKMKCTECFAADCNANVMDIGQSVAHNLTNDFFFNYLFLTNGWESRLDLFGEYIYEIYVGNIQYYQEQPSQCNQKLSSTNLHSSMYIDAENGLFFIVKLSRIILVRKMRLKTWRLKQTSLSNKATKL